MKFALGKINHVAIATPNIKKSSLFYKNVLQATVSKEEPLPDHGVTTVFVSGTEGQSKIELLEQLGDQSPIANFLKKNPNGGVHHICYEVDNIEAAIKHLEASGVRVLAEKGQPKIKTGAHGLPVAFLHPKDCGNVLIELEQKSK